MKEQIIKTIYPRAQVIIKTKDKIYKYKSNNNGLLTVCLKKNNTYQIISSNQILIIYTNHNLPKQITFNEICPKNKLPIIIYLSDKNYNGLPIEKGTMTYKLQKHHN